jgi:hypothetical protein
MSRFGLKLGASSHLDPEFYTYLAVMLPQRLRNGA